jgi:DNA-binding response OmpR family regulator
MEPTKLKRILVIEDDRSFLDMLKLRLELNGFEVATESDGLNGFERVRKIHPDLVVLDLQLPKGGSPEEPEDSDMDRNFGHKICRMIKFDHTLQKIPVLILTCSDSPEDIGLALRCGADGYMMKTGSMDVLVFQIKKLLHLIGSENGESSLATEQPALSTV